MKKITLLFTFLFFALSIFAQTGEKKLALVIGNSAYQHGATLKNPVNDANLMARTLQNLGFTVIKRLNANLRTMQLATAKFTDEIKNYNVALFYYAGHGIQIDGQNYLIPVDAKLDERVMTKFEAFNISFINDAFMQNNENVNIMILDACRDNPFRSWVRGGERGFKKIDNSTRGTIIAFATQPGETASDGKGLNGLYTAKLVEQMKIPQNIENVFKNTRIAVNSASGGKQVPQDWSSLMGDFYFTKNTSTKKNNTINTSTPTLGNAESTATYGSIELNTEISGTLYIDGSVIGSVNANTRVPVNKVITGNRKIEILGKEIWTGTVNVYKNQTAKVTAKSNKPAFDLPNQITDNRDGKTYKIVKIGNQVWMAENLAYKSYSGCWAYDNKQSNVNQYGYLYNWETAKEVCPAGWHLPSKSEFETLLDNYGNSKASYTALIPTGNSGFSALLGGIGSSGVFWSSSAGGDTYSWCLAIGNSHKKAKIRGTYKSAGLSVRCLQD